jgi:cytochrome c biogenesis protein CcmG, thiol:disulfide interchange protein DsbE
MNQKRILQQQKNNKVTIIWLGVIGIGLIFISAALMISSYRSGKSIIATNLKNQYSTTPVEVNYPTPELNLTNLNSNEVSLNQFPGEVVLVNNWATWCPPCKAEMPTLQAYYLEHKDAGFLIIAIESGESPDEVREFVTNYGITFPVWIDRKGEALSAFKNWDLPSSYVIDRSGVIRLTWTGEISMEMLEKFVTPLLEN